MIAKFVISHLEQQIGPFTESELKSKWNKGELLPIDYVYDEAKQDWILFTERFAWAIEANPPPIKMPVDKRRPKPLVRDAPVASPVGITPAGTAVKIINGIGELDLANPAAGQVEVVVQDGLGLKPEQPFRIQVRPHQPTEIMWGFPLNPVVGSDFEINIKAVDEKGVTCAQFAGSFVIRIAASEPREISVTLSDGLANIKITNTKAEGWSLTFHSLGGTDLRLPNDQKLEWLPGPAARLILDGPPELVAGEPLKVQVKAVDEYGNLAKTYQGTAVLQVKAS